MQAGQAKAGSRTSTNLCRLLAALAATTTKSAELLRVVTHPAAGDPLARIRLAVTLCSWQLPSSTLQMTGLQDPGPMAAWQHEAQQRRAGQQTEQDA